MAQENNNNNNNNDTEAVVVTVTEEKTTDETKEEKPLGPIPEENKSPLKLILNKRRILMLSMALMTFLLSIPFLFEAIWLIYMRQLNCEALLKSLPRLQIGIAIGLICVFIISNGVVYSRARFPALGLMVMQVPLLVLLVVGLTLRGSFNVETRQIPGSPSWLKAKVHADANWNPIKSCLFDTRICRDLVARSYNHKLYDFVTSHFSPIQSGCCSPPSVCEMEQVNTTYWRKANTESSNMDAPDCNTWRNDETILCYDCGACKKGFVNTLETKWLKLGTFLIIMSLLLMLSHLLLFISTMWDLCKA